MNTTSIQTSIFDTIDGLPIHPLAVHVAVVFLPLSAMALALLVFVPRWRKTYLPLTLIGLGIATVFTFIARESGQALADRVGGPKTHTELGGILFPAAVGLLAVGVAFYFLQKSNKPKWIVQATAGAAIAAVLSVSGLTYFVGHTGAQASWAKRIGPIASPTPTPTGTETTGTGITVAKVATHNKATDCWTIVKSDVYDLTSYIQQHPGGAGVITNLCGIDASSAFDAQHSNQMAPASALAALKIGRIGEVPTTTPKPTVTPTPTPTKTTPKPTAGTYTKAQVATHKTGSDCWSIVNKKVYNLTSYVSSHPGGAAVISAICGKDGTAGFTGQHGGQTTPTSVLSGLLIGTLAASSTNEPPPVAKTYTSAQVASHNSGASCWGVVSKSVYDLTSYVSSHPGGASAISALCGKDATSAFTGQHGGQANPTNVLASFKLGTLSGTNTLPIAVGEEEEEEEEEED
jgi:cytochrome b involved in lipid metabolism